MTPGWYSIGDEALHWFERYDKAARSLCGKIERMGELRQANGSYCMRCELRRRGLWDGRSNELKAA